MRNIKYVKEEPLSVNGIKVVGSYDEAIVNVVEKKTPVARFEFGDSLHPFLVSGEYTIIRPKRDNDIIDVGTIVFCRVLDYDMIHMVVGIKDNKDGKRYVIGDTHGYVFGDADEIYGICEPTSVAVLPRD